MAYTTVDDSGAFFKAHLYTGDGATNAQTFSGTTMSPNLVWIKNRDATDINCLFDTVRGATELISSNDGDAEVTDADTLTSFDANGFTVDTDVKVNTNTEKYVSWNWNESVTAGFDAVGYTGTGVARTVAHNLGVVPHFMCVRRYLSDGDSWRVYHHKNTAAPETDYLALNTTAATADSNLMWNDTLPDASNFTVGTAGSINENTKSFISYVWTGVQGYSRFNTYKGNADTNGRFVYTGFRPAYVMVKASSTTGLWYIFDDKREGQNDSTLGNNRLYANDTSVESTNSHIDILSNGFKCVTTDAGVNGANQYVYAAWAQSPFTNSSGVPSNAR